MMPRGGNRIEDEVPAVNWRYIFYSTLGVLLLWVGYAAVEAIRHAGSFDTKGPQATAELFVREHMRYELMEQGQLHFHGAKETQVEKLEENRYRVTGTVDVIEASGQAREEHYFCTLKLTPGGEWAAEKVYVLPSS